MERRGSWITLGGVLLAALVTAGTGLYLRGIAPPFPANLHAFQLLLLACFLYALAFGRPAPGVGS